MSTLVTTTKSGGKIMHDTHIRDEQGQSVNFAKDETLTNGNQITKIKETPPDDSTKTNSSYVLHYNAAGEVVYVDEIIGANTYRTTFTRSDMVVTSTLPISGAVKL